MPRPTLALVLGLALTAGWLARPEARPATGLAAAGSPQDDRLDAAGAIRGRVRFAGTTPPAGTRPRVSGLGGAAGALVDRRRSVVYLDAVPRGAFDELPTTRVRMDQRDEQFVPRLLAITVGTVVEFPNSDVQFHNVFSLSRTHPFDLGRYPPGRSSTERFDRPGIVRVFCDIHSHMSAYILVFSHPYFAVTNTEDRYVISGVPPGSYTLVVWSELGAAEPRRVTVGAGAAVEVDFLVGRAG
jgi:plastocyanin